MEIRFNPTSRGFERIEVIKGRNEMMPPKHILDNMVEDAISRRKREENEMRRSNPNLFGRERVCSCPRFAPEMPMPKREEGIIAKISKPKMEEYYSMREFEHDMFKFNQAERAIKACDWDERKKNDLNLRELEEVLLNLFSRL